MPTRCLRRLILLACLALGVLPGVARAGDAPIFLVGDWGVGEIDGRIMFYTGRDSYVFTRVPAPPRGPRWNLAYDGFQFAVLGGVGVWLYRRVRRAGAARRGFEVREVAERGPGG